MAERHLESLISYDKAMLEHLAKRKCVLAKDLLGKTQLEQIHELDLTLPVLLDLQRLVSSKIAPKPTTVMHLIKKKTEDENTLKTSLEALDAYLRGGLQPASITEVVGPAGVGKTQFSHMVTSIAVLPQSLGGLGDDVTVYYFDTEHAFSSTRLAELLVQRQPLYANDPQNFDSMVRRVKVFHITSTDAFLKQLDIIEDEIIESNVKLIVLDSVASLVRKEFDSSSMPERQSKLSKISSKLKSFAENYQFPVLITNQVTTNTSGSSFVTAALGTLWSHAINTRIVLEFADLASVVADLSVQDLHESIDPNVLHRLRLMVIGKSPVAPVVSFPYYIDQKGISLLRRRAANADAMDIDGEEAAPSGDVGDDFVVLINPQNYWDHSIAVNRPQPSSALQY